MKNVFVDRVAARQSRGFTLIEVLVVCAVIMLLLAIGLPMLSRAMAAAQLATCGAQHQQIGRTNAGLLADQFNQFSPMGTFR